MTQDEIIGIDLRIYMHKLREIKKAPTATGLNLVRLGGNRKAPTIGALAIR